MPIFPIWWYSIAHQTGQVPLAVPDPYPGLIPEKPALRLSHRLCETVGYEIPLEVHWNLPWCNCDEG